MDDLTRDMVEAIQKSNIQSILKTLIIHRVKWYAEPYADGI